MLTGRTNSKLQMRSKNHRSGEIDGEKPKNEWWAGLKSDGHFLSSNLNLVTAEHSRKKLRDVPPPRHPDGIKWNFQGALERLRTAKHMLHY
jgi:hypothetical protein